MSAELRSPRLILGSWKEIARFLHRDVRTVQRWEKEEALPVHRHYHHSRSSVYAYADEIDRWWRERGPRLAQLPASRPHSFRRVVVVCTLATAGGVGIALVSLQRPSPRREAPAVFGKVIATGSPLVNPVSVALSPDGGSLYVSDIGARAIFCMDAGDGTVRELTSFARTGFPGLDTARLLTLSPDGATLYVAGWAAASVFAVSTATGKVRLLASGPPLERPHGIAVSSDGTLLFVTDNYAGRVFRLSASGGQPFLLATGIPEPLDVAPVGSTLFVTSGEAAVYTLPATGGRAQRLLAGPPCVRPTGIVATADASVVYFIDDAQFGRRPPPAVYSVNASGSGAVQLFAGPPLAFPVDLAVAPDGSSLFVADASYGSPGAVYRLDLYERVALDILPGVPPNLFDPLEAGDVEVAVLADTRLDGRELDPRSARFGPRGVPPLPGQLRREDVDHDGREDLVLRFAGALAGLTCGSSRASLTIRTFGGRRLQGNDEIVTPDCRAPRSAP